MTVKKILCLALGLILALGTLALAESDDLQASLDAANARIAELEAEVEKYKPVYESQILAEYGDGQVVLLGDAREEFQMVSQLYSQYGISIDDYADEIKQSIIEGDIEEAVKDQKIAELGLADLDEATMAEITQSAAESWEGYVDYMLGSLDTEGKTDEEARAMAVERLHEMGYSEESLVESLRSDRAAEALVTYVTKDVALDDAQLQAAYEEMVESDQTDYEDNDYSYNSARTSGALITWNPEGYRAVKHVLIKFDSDQSARYSDLKSTLDSLNQELAALDDVEAEAEAENDEAAEETAPRAREEIQADIGNVGAAIEALYSELLPKAQQVIDAFNGGTAFDELIATYGEDPGMTQEPSASQGYAVSAESSYWDTAFTEGAMSIAEVGGISEPVRGQYGIHIIYYLSDITPGPVPLDDVREQVMEAALETARSDAFDAQVAAWVEAAHPVYHLDRFVG